MKKLLTTLITFTLVGCTFGQIVSKETVQEAKVENIEYFIVLKNGDTLIGNKISAATIVEHKTYNKLNFIKIDGKRINAKDVLCYQDKKAYYLIDEKGMPLTRIRKGKINLYAYNYYTYFGSDLTQRVGFLFQDELKTIEKPIALSYENLLPAISSNEKATALLLNRFPKKQNLVKDLDTVFEIFDVFNKKKK